MPVETIKVITPVLLGHEHINGDFHRPSLYQIIIIIVFVYLRYVAKEEVFTRHLHHDAIRPRVLRRRALRELDQRRRRLHPGPVRRPRRRIPGPQRVRRDLPRRAPLPGRAAFPPRRRASRTGTAAPAYPARVQPPQAFGQCIRFLSSRLRGVETIDVSSTSRAAELAKADPTGSSAAVSSAVAASLLGLDVLARNVEDREDNTTRFFVLRRGATTTTADAPIPELEEVLDEQRRKRAGPEGAEALVEGEGRGGDVYARTKSLASFTVPHRAPGALADVLESFRRARLNLTSISSRPSLAAPFRYVFFVEFEGHRERDPEGRVRAALEGAAAAAQSCRWLGSWDSMR